MIGRRRLAASGASIALAGMGAFGTSQGASPPCATAGPDAELLAACAAFLAAQGEWDAWNARADIPEEIADELGERWYRTLVRLTGLRARTAAGMRTKALAAYIAMSTLQDDPKDLEHENLAAMAVLADLLAGGTA